MSYDPLYQIKDIVYEKYKIEKELGQGSYGKIYLVCNELEKKQYALKISKKLAPLSFNREIEALNKIKRPESMNQKSYVINMIEHFEASLQAKNIETEEAEINLNNSLSPVCIKPISEEEYIYIVTPVRVIF